METRKPYPTNVSDEEWSFVAPYLTLMTPDAPQREYNLREVFDATCWIVRTGAPWRYLPNDFPRWEAVYQQTQRWLKAGSFEAIVHALRELLRVTQGRNAQPSAVIFDARTLQSTPESGGRAGYDGHKRKKGSKTHVAVDTLGHLLAMVVTPVCCCRRPLLCSTVIARSRVSEWPEWQGATRGAATFLAWTGRKALHSLGLPNARITSAVEDGGLLAVPRRMISPQRPVEGYVWGSFGSSYWAASG